MSRGASDSIEISAHPPKPRDVIVIGVPSFGMVHLFFMARYYNLRMPLNTIQKHIYVVGKEVGDARNEIVAKALALEDRDPTIRCSKVFFIDDDVLIHPDALLKLLAHDRPMISGLYYTKTSVPTPLVLHGEYGGTATNWTPGDVVECFGHGMGLTLIDADVFRNIAARCIECEGDGDVNGGRCPECRGSGEFPTDAYGYPAWFKTTKDASVTLPDGRRNVSNQTEDMRFLGYARSLGYQPAVDTSPQAFGWHFDTKALKGYPEKQWRQFCETGQVTWDTAAGPVTWGGLS